MKAAFLWQRIYSKILVSNSAGCVHLILFKIDVKYLAICKPYTL